ncbi:MAG: O-antigen ligase family protein [Bacteroidota bacterium]
MIAALHKTSKPLDRLIAGLYLLLLAVLPFSVPAQLGSHQLEMPSEPLIIVLSMLLASWYQQHREQLSSLLRSTIGRISLLWLGWMGVCSLFSTLPFVSLKYWLVSIAHWWVFFAGFFVLARQLPKDLFALLSAYALSFGLVMLYAWTVHAQYDFRIDVSVLTARPFYFDHALYSACLLLLLPIYTTWAVQKTRKSGLSKGQRRFSIVMGLIFSTAVYLSFSRAAWLSSWLCMWFLGLTLLFRMGFRTWIILIGVGLLSLTLLWSPVREQLKNNQAESKNHGFLNQVISTANISTDVSNLERLNRYKCALRMFSDRPLLGFGPGTYQFAYLPYQRPEEMTRISVSDTGPHGPGRGGGAHSEYLQALSEMGLPGLLIWLGLVLAGFHAGLTIFRKTATKSHKWLAMGVLLGLMTYFIHGLFNNFLHHGKLAVLVWILLAALSVLQQKITAPKPGPD